jgi:hypothetical protein
MKQVWERWKSGRVRRAKSSHIRSSVVCCFMKRLQATFNAA